MFLMRQIGTHLCHVYCQFILFDLHGLIWLLATDADGTFCQGISRLGVKSRLGNTRADLTSRMASYPSVRTSDSVSFAKDAPTLSTESKVETCGSGCGSLHFGSLSSLPLFSTFSQNHAIILVSKIATEL